jgi:hypothetical protein
VHLFEPKFMEHVFSVERKVESENMASRRVTTNNYRENHAPSPNLTQPTRLTPQQLDEIREIDYVSTVTTSTIRGIKAVRKLFYIDFNKEEDQELEPSQD